MKQNYLLLLLLLSFVANAQKLVSGLPASTPNDAIAEPPDNCETDNFFLANIIAGLTFDGTYFYTSQMALREIHKYDINGVFSGSIPYPGVSLEGAGDLDFDGTNLWVVAEQDGILYKISPLDGTVLTSFPLPTTNTSDPNNFGCAYDNGYLWNTEYLDETLVRIDAITGAIVDSFAINRRVLPLKIVNGDLYGIEFASNEVTDNFMQLVKFDKTTGAVLEEIPLPCINYSLGIAWADNHLWSISGAAETRGVYRFANLLPVQQFGLLNAVKIFPNPASKSILVNSAQIIDSVTVYNLTGTKIYEAHPQQENCVIEVSAFQKGLYLLQIATADATQTEKIVVR